MLELAVRNDSSVAACVAEVLARAGSIDVLVNNAGTQYYPRHARDGRQSGR
jgi:NAD(P)-dependent dehydrogenase (short-subunit alcohol dehydrogenase family)